MENRELSIYIFYNNNIQPLLKELSARNNGVIPTNCMNEVRAINDHIARCYRVNIDEDKVNEELAKAEGHLRRLIFDCFKQLNIFLSDNIKKVERRYFSHDWLKWDNGNFWKIYTEKMQCAVESVVEAKKSESLDSDMAMRYFNDAYDAYSEVERLLNDHSRLIRFSWIKHCIIYPFKSLYLFAGLLALAALELIVCWLLGL